MSLILERLEKRILGRPVLLSASAHLEGPGNVALTGENGSGKTTLLRLLAGISAPDAGFALLLGEPLTGFARRARRHMGYVPEGADLPAHLVARELLALVAALKGAPPLAADLTARLGVDAILGQRIGAMSLGQRRRTCIAAALVGDPWLLLLDEPTNGLDPEGITVLAGLLRERTAAGKAALFATHDLAFAQNTGARRWQLVGGQLAMS